MRSLLLLGAGIAIGIVLTFIAVAVMGGWYVYFMLTPDECHGLYGNAVTAEVVPNQPNPCHFRRLRWRLLY